MIRFMARSDPEYRPPHYFTTGPRRKGSGASLGRRLQRFGAPGDDAPLELGAEVADQALDRPGGGVAKRADRMSFDLLGDIPQHVDLVDLGLARDQPLHHPDRKSVV